MKLKEKLDNMPANKTIKFVELFLLSYNKIKQNNIKPTRVMYTEEDFIKILNKKVTDDYLGKELDKMVKSSSYSVLIQVIEISNALSNSIN